MSNSVTRHKGTLKIVSASIFFKFFSLKSNRGYLTLHCKSFHLQILNFQKIGQKCKKCNFQTNVQLVNSTKSYPKTGSCLIFFKFFYLKSNRGYLSLH